MHDELIERRLRGALHDEAAALPFTITAAELERRAHLRGRSFPRRRLTLLLAAAVGIGLLGVGGALSGLFDQPRPTPSPTPPVAVVESEAPNPTGPIDLPTLDELVAVDPGGVVVAQAHGPTDAWGLPVAGEPPSMINLGRLDGGDWGSYLLSVACLHTAELQFDVGDPLSPSGPADGPTIPCDGRTHEAGFEAFGQDLTFQADGGASWRVVVRGPKPAPAASVDPEQPLMPDAGEDELVRFSDVVNDSAPPVGDSDMVMQPIGGLATRETYTVRIRCASGETFRVAFGNDLEDQERVIGNQTQLACDGGVHVIRQSILEPYGGQIYVVGRPGSRLDLLVTGETPPIDLVRSQPGWTLSSGLGPNFTFDGTAQGFTGPGIDGGGTIVVAMACTGTKPIEVTVEVGPKIGDRQESFTADCSPDGLITSQSFKVAGSYVDVTFSPSPLTWTALAILSPDDGP